MKNKTGVFGDLRDPHRFLLLDFETGNVTVLRGTREQMLAAVEEAEKELDIPKLAS